MRVDRGSLKAKLYDKGPLQNCLGTNAQPNQTPFTLSSDLYQPDEVYDIALAADVIYNRENWPWLSAIDKIARQVLMADSRVKEMPSQNYHPAANMTATTPPYLNEFDGFKSVVFIISDNKESSDSGQPPQSHLM